MDQIFSLRSSSLFSPDVNLKFDEQLQQLVVSLSTVNFFQSRKVYHISDLSGARFAFITPSGFLAQWCIPPIDNHLCLPVVLTFRSHPPLVLTGPTNNFAMAIEREDFVDNVNAFIKELQRKQHGNTYVPDPPRTSIPPSFYTINTAATTLPIHSVNTSSNLLNNTNNNINNNNINNNNVYNKDVHREADQFDLPLQTQPSTYNNRNYTDISNTVVDTFRPTSGHASTKSKQIY